jgi:hypothetical protein
MADVIALAKERRARLAAEVSKLDDFIQMAELLVKYGASRANAQAEGAGEPGERPRPTMVRPVPQG